ncbi:hypothetical protein C9374_010127 [Naegleria lovaniensis]|uniref:WWE domain-containing protein n=1 Tax=Naegleria lovaniensis TaxID=51637 RepID=A0AA88KEL3_NAELO|nr:uncharacterized protein C9374_010127 [Naegleria lovaniensis]KAG2375123.1 hypothetical protein C9374_010127 [Naegleria lovaniensis]
MVHLITGSITIKKFEKEKIIISSNMIPSPSASGHESSNNKRKREDIVVVGNAPPTLSSDHLYSDQELEIKSFFEQRESQQEELIEQITRELSELQLEKSLENFMKKLSLNDDHQVNAVPSSANDDGVPLSNLITSRESDSLEIKKMLQIKRMQHDELVVLNVGGRFFRSTMKTLIGEGHLVDSSPSLNDPISSKTDDDMTSSSVADASTTPTSNQHKHFDNLFKVMFSSNFSIEYDSANNEGIKAINFLDRNPDHFEYVLEHLRQNGRVKCLGLENLSLETLKGIKEESEYFLTEKLTNYITMLMEKKLSGTSTSENLNIPSQPQQQQTSLVVNQRLEKNVPPEWLEHFKNYENSVKEKREYYLLKTKDMKTLTVNQVKELSKALKHRLVSFVEGVEQLSDLYVQLDISGTIFNIPFRVFKEHPQFIVYKYINSDNFALTEKGTIFLDRNPAIFQLIYSYLMSGTFNNFPVMDKTRKSQLKHELKFYQLHKILEEYFDPCRYPIETIGKENIKLKEKEDFLRELYVKDRNNPLLDDKYLLLSPLFSMMHQVTGEAKNKYAIPDAKKLLQFTDETCYTRPVPEPVVVESLEAFKQSWSGFTNGLLQGLNYDNVFAAGGSVLACILDGQKMPPKQKHYYHFANENPTLRSKSDSDDEEEGFDEQTSEPLHNSTLKDETEKIERDKLMSFDYNWEYSDANFANRRSSTGSTRMMHASSVFGNSISSSFSNTPSSLNMTTGFSAGMPIMATSTLPMPTLPSFAAGFNFTPLSTVPTTISSTTIPGTGAIIFGVSTSLTTGVGNNGMSTSHQVSNAPSSFSSSDIDLFLYGLTPEQAEDKLRHIYQVIKQNCSRGNVLVARSKFAVTFHTQHNRAIQVILRIYKSPAEILLGFDICAACLGFDGNQVWSNARSRRALALKTNLIDPDRMSTTYEYRLYKYAKHGFSVTIPGYDPSLVKNHLVTYPRRYRSKYIQVRGLAKLIIIDSANRTTHINYLLSDFESRRDYEKVQQLKLLRQVDREKASDYEVSPLNVNKYRDMQQEYQRLKNTSEFFTQLNKKNNRIWKPYYVLALNDIEKCIHDTEHASRLTEKIEFVTVDPGSQRVGSFNPIIDNFYRDAYDYATEVKPQVLTRRRQFKTAYHATWSWEKNLSTHSYEAYSPFISNKIEIAYRKYLKDPTASEVHIMDNYKIDFTTMQQINTSDQTKRRKINRVVTTSWGRTYTLAPVSTVGYKTFY